MQLKGTLGKRLASVSKELSLTALGKIKADTVIKNGRIINVNTGEVEEGKDIAIKYGWIVLVGNAEHVIGPDTEIIDASGYILAPGFLDGHLHIESSMVTVRQFAEAVLPRGTTTVFMDPHEIANVLGMDGIKLMLEEGEDLPLKVFCTMPSCVPAAPSFEDAGAIFKAKEIREAMKWDNIIGLGEMMNFPGVLNGDPDVHEELRATLEADKVITGHYASPDLEIGLQSYAAAGISSCHEGTTKEDTLARMRLGMYAKLREGSAWQDVAETVKAITENNIDTRYAVLVTDDVHPQTLVKEGHLDRVLRKALQEGVDPITAIQMVTINTAQCFKLDRFIGSIAPGRCADIVFLKNTKLLADVSVEKVMANGVIVAENNVLKTSFKEFKYPEYARNTVHLKKKLTEEDFKITAPEGKSFVKAHVIEVIEAQAGTIHKVLDLPVVDGQVPAFPEKDIAKVMVMERHGGPGNYALGFVTGFNLKKGAVASTVAHDSHNLLVIGTNDSDMALAGNTLAENGGGMVVVEDGEVLALLALPIAGLMSDKPVFEVAEGVAELDKAWKRLGCQIESPFMTMALISLAVLPEIRITNRGIVDTLNFCFIDAIE